MAGENIGRVEFLVGLDGSRLPTEARALGNEIAAEGGKSGDNFAKEFERAAGPRMSQFSKDISQTLSKDGALAGGKLANDFANEAKKRVQAKKFDVVSALFDQHGFDDFVRKFGDVDAAVEHLKGTMAALTKENVFDKEGNWQGLVLTKREMAELSKTTDEFAANLSSRLVPALREGEREGNKFTQWLHKANEEAKSGGSAWNSLSANTRQWTAIITAVIGAFSDLAVLGSAAGSGLFVVGAALSSLVTVGGLAAVMFVRLLGNIKKLPPALKPARAEFDVFHKAVSGALDAMTIAAFKDSIGGWKSLTTTVKALTPALQLVGHEFGQLFNDFAAAVKPGSPVFQGLDYFLKRSVGIFDTVIRQAGEVGTALLIAFKNPNLQTAIQNFLGWIGQLATGFSNFLTGPGFDEWLRHGTEVFGSFGKLLSTTGQLLNDMVTDETVNQLTDFIDAIDGFLKGGGRGIIDFATKLDVFGLLAQALDEVGKALAPLSGPMQELASALNAVLSTGIKELADILGAIATALAPVVSALADFMKLHPKAVADGILLIAGAWVVFKGAKGILGVAGQISDVIGKLDEFHKKTPMWQKSIGALAAGVIASLPSTADGTVSGSDVVSGLASGLLAGAAVGGPIGAAIGAIGALITSMLSDMLGQQKGPWKKGWDQLFDPSDFSGAGIGAIKQWVADQFGPWLTDMVSGWQHTLEDWRDVTLPAWWKSVQDWWGGLTGSSKNSWLDDIVTTWQTTLNNLKDNTLPTWWQGVQTWWNGLTGNSKNSWLDQVVTNWMNTLGTLRANTTTWWGQVQAGWSTFFSTVQTIIGNAWGVIVAILTGGDIQAAWSRLWASLPKPVQDAWNAVTSAISSAIGVIKTLIGGLYTPIQNAISWFQSLFGAAQKASGAAKSAGGGQGGYKMMASGGMLLGPRRILAGEAGPEAIVPLRRPLSQVDPSVRWLSAIAQQKRAMPMATGGIAGTGKVVNVAEGAIQIFGALDPRRDANEVLVRLAEQAAG